LHKTALIVTPRLSADWIIRTLVTQTVIAHMSPVVPEAAAETRAKSLGGHMFDAQKLLQQVLGGDESKDGKRGISPDTLKGAAIGGLAGLLLGSKTGRHLGGSALRMGGMAALAGLAYKAWQNWQEQQRQQTSAPHEMRDVTPKPQETFLPKQQAEQNELSLTLLSAMISAAKADGHIDAAEQTRIFAKLDKSNLSAEEKGFLMDEIRKPLDVDALVTKATTPESAAEIYAASLMAIDPDGSTETEYLDTLATRLNLDPGLRSSIEEETRKAAISTG
jgi:uncharacterized membrane protein YebE (DUF533 family)